MAQPASDIANDVLVRALDRWRFLAASAVVVIGIVATAAFALVRSTTTQVSRAGNILVLASEAQEAVWSAEAAVRALLLKPGIDSARARARAARTGTARALLMTLRDSVAGNPQQAARVDSILTGLDAWESTFATAVLTGAPLSRELALSGTLAFDAMAHPFQGLIADERRARVQRLESQNALLWTAYFILLGSLGVTFVAIRRLTAGLQLKAEEAAARQRQVEDQATELGHQAELLEEQAAQLEEQTESLRENVADRDHTLALFEETSRFLDAALDGSPYGIAFYDRQLRYLRINPVLATMNGASPEAHIGRTIDDMVPHLAPTARPIIERVLATGTVTPNVIIEGSTAAQGEARRRWLVTFYPIPGPLQTVAGVGCIVQDVTEQYHTEQQLRQAQKLEAVGRLAGGIAHDFNNVLTVIQSYAEVLGMELGDRGESREEVDAISAAANRAAGLARQLLTFARREVIIARDVNVRDVVLGMQLIMRRLVPASVQLVLELDEEPLVVRIDPGQLEQVVMNLAINAVDAMPDGGRLVIRSSRGPAGDDGRAQALIEVADTGTGMPESVRERLFEPFFTTKPVGRGTGLGLATSYTIVREAGGRIDVASALGAGSTFRVFLPLAVVSDDARPRRSSPIRGVDVPGGTERILIAEDEPAIRTAVSRILSAAGYDVLEAQDGNDALALANAHKGPIHLLLSDVMMPGMGGKELVRQLAESRPETRVVLMSGYTDDEALRADLGAARYAFLQKPFTARDIMLAVRTALDAS